MKKYIFASLMLIGALAAGLLSSCARPTVLGATETRTYDFSGFSTIEVGHRAEFFLLGSLPNVPVDVRVERADTYSVSITANQNIFAYIDVSRAGDTLRIIVDKQRIASASAVINARISVPELSGIKVSGVDMTADVFSAAPVFKAQVSGAGTLDIDLQAGNAEFDISSASQTTVRGTVQDLLAEVSGAAELDVQAQARDVTLRISSAGRVKESGDIRNLAVTGSGVGSLESDLRSTGAIITLSSASRVTGNLSTGEFKADLSGASRIALKGAGSNGYIEGSSASNIDLPDFKLANANVNLSGASEADIYVTGKLDAELSSSSSLVYGGNPSLGATKVGGGSTLRRR